MQKQLMRVQAQCIPFIRDSLKRKSWSAGETWNSSSCLGDSPVVFGQEFTTLTGQTAAIPSKSWHCFGEVESILASKLPRFVPYLHPGWYSPNGTKSCHVFSSHSQHIIPRPTLFCFSTSECLATASWLKNWATRSTKESSCFVKRGTGGF